MHGRKGAGGWGRLREEIHGGRSGIQGIEKKRVGWGKKAEEGARKVFGVDIHKHMDDSDKASRVDIHKHMHESKCKRVKRGRINTV